MTAAHVICCNDSVEHVVIGTEEQAQAKLEELAKEHFDRFGGNTGEYDDHSLYRHLGETPYERYRQRLYWHIHTVAASS
jgi:hypothetical protein